MTSVDDHFPERTLFGHPKGLTVLFLTETWAHFSYYGMRALLIYYMIKQLDFSQPVASGIFGAYGAFAFLTPFAGGLIADRYLGRRRSVILGALLMAAGHFALISEQAFFPALILVALGNGFFVPAITSQVGGLYREGDPRRDRAYSIYYMGINLGSFVAPLLCGWLGERFGWHYGFGAAGIGMLIGLIIYLPNQRFLGDHAASERPRGETRDLGAKGWHAVRTLLLVSAIVVLFRIAYEQSGNTIAIWADSNTNRQLGGFLIPAAWFQSINPALILLLTPLLATWWGRQALRGRERTNLSKMALGCILGGLAFVTMIGAAFEHDASGSASSLWLVGFFVLLTLGELYVLPVGLSLFSKLSPVQAASSMVGVWYLAKFAGSLAAGWLGMFWESMSPGIFFSIGAATSFAAALLFWLASKRIAGEMAASQ